MADLWQLCRLGDVAEVVRETINPATLGDQDVHYYSIPAYDSGHPETTPVSAIRSNKLRIGPDTILVSRINPQIPRTWRPRPVEKHLALASTEFVPLRAKAGVDSAFLFQACRSPDFYHSMTAMATGTTGSHQRVDLSGLLNIRLSLPPLSEQRAIAEVLGALDDKIEANRSQVDLLESLISASWEDASSESSEWSQQPISEVAKIVGGSTPRTSVPGYWDGSISWATPKDLSRLTSTPLFRTERSITEQGLQQISSGLLPRGTVLLSSRAPIGYLAIAEVPLAINQGFIALNSLGAVPDLYLWQWVAHHMAEIKDRANGTTFQEISKANFRPIGFDVPPAMVIDRWMNVAEPLYQLVVKLEHETSILATLRDTLLPKLVSGELRVRDAEPLVEEVV